MAETNLELERVLDTRESFSPYTHHLTTLKILGEFSCSMRHQQANLHNSHQKLFMHLLTF